MPSAINAHSPHLSRAHPYLKPTNGRVPRDPREGVSSSIRHDENQDNCSSGKFHKDWFKNRKAKDTVILNSSEGIQFAVQDYYLKAHSPVLRDIIDKISRTKGIETKLIDLVDTSAQVLSIALDTIIGDHSRLSGILLNAERYLSLVKFADIYAIKILSDELLKLRGDIMHRDPLGFLMILSAEGNAIPDHLPGDELSKMKDELLRGKPMKDTILALQDHFYIDSSYNFPARWTSYSKSIYSTDFVEAESPARSITTQVANALGIPFYRSFTFALDDALMQQNFKSGYQRDRSDPPPFARRWTPLRSDNENTARQEVAIAQTERMQVCSPTENAAMPTLEADGAGQARSPSPPRASTSIVSSAQISQRPLSVVQDRRDDDTEVRAWRRNQYHDEGPELWKEIWESMVRYIEIEYGMIQDSGGSGGWSGFALEECIDGDDEAGGSAEVARDRYRGHTKERGESNMSLDEQGEMEDGDVFTATTNTVRDQED